MAIKMMKWKDRNRKRWKVKVKFSPWQVKSESEVLTLMKSESEDEKWNSHRDHVAEPESHLSPWAEQLLHAYWWLFNFWQFLDNIGNCLQKPAGARQSTMRRNWICSLKKCWRRVQVLAVSKTTQKFARLKNIFSQWAMSSQSVQKNPKSLPV